jgi:hypothetical protein
MRILDDVAKSENIRHTTILVFFTKVAVFRCKLPVVGDFLVRLLKRLGYYFV